MVKRVSLIVLALMMSLFLTAALAEDTVSLKEAELSAWVDEMLRKSAPLTPLNHPVDETARTEEGYAFLYEFATLYYNQAELNAQSILQSVSVTDPSCPPLRGITLGTDAETLLAAFGSANPYLLGDGSFAALYLRDEMPRAAYWSWAQLDPQGELTGLQCAMHVRLSDGRYTDAGVRFVLEGGKVTEIRVYGLYEYITEEDVLANLDAVRAVEDAIARGALAEEEMEAYTHANSAEMFGLNDLAFEGLRFQDFRVEELEQKLGSKAQTQTLSDAGQQLVTAEWDGVYASGTAGGWDVLSVSTDRIAGPRGLRVGQSSSEVLGLFYADGEAREWNGQTLLYGDGQTASYAVQDGSHVMYTVMGEGESVTLRLQFSGDRLEEWMIYTW